MVAIVARGSMVTLGLVRGTWEGSTALVTRCHVGESFFWTVKTQPDTTPEASGITGQSHSESPGALVQVTSSVNEVIITAISQAYMTHASGFCYHPGGINIASPEAVGHVSWRTVRIAEQPTYEAKQVPILFDDNRATVRARSSPGTAVVTEASPSPTPARHAPQTPSQNSMQARPPPT
ncbi:hypothetical protein O988_09362 [Pseudogymnoascus sp. VKM F-3808]|nr:hypothetical protein O988_09362 [Pseudogymnoascus sp. VKM F-3808]